MYDMVINYGSRITETAYEAIERSGLRGKLAPEMSILIKPNLVMAKPAKSGATTHHEVVRALLIFLTEAGCRRITIAESAWAGGDTKQAFDVCGYTALAKEFNVPLYDLKDDTARRVMVKELELTVCEAALNTDFLINVPVLKAHCQTSLTCCLKNLKGVIPDSEKRRYHTLGLHRPIALLNKAVKTSFCLVDGICGDLTFEEGGNPIDRGMIIAGEDPLTIDSYAAALLGYDPREIGYLTRAEELKIGKLYAQTTRVLELNKDKKPKLKPADSGLVNRLKEYTCERDACSVCFASLISALHKTGFVPRGKISIGQGFRDVKSDGCGVGNCCRGFAHNVPGCPPSASEIAKALEMFAR